MSDNPASSAVTSPSKNQFNAGRLLVTIVIVVGVFAGLFVFFGLFDGWQKLQELGNPKLVPVTGSVIFDGEPLRRGTVVTEPAEGNWRGSIGFIDETGKFSLKTDLRQGRVEGAYVGKHKVAVQIQRTDVKLGAFAPPSLVPDQYASPATTPVTFEVKSDGANHIEIVIEGDETHRAEKPRTPSEPAAESEQKPSEPESKSESGSSDEATSNAGAKPSPAEDDVQKDGAANSSSPATDTSTPENSTGQ